MTHPSTFSCVSQEVTYTLSAFAIALLTLANCSRTSPPRGGAQQAALLRTVPGSDATPLRDKLGVNYTWAADKRIVTDDTAQLSGAFRHVRYFLMTEKDYDGGWPATTTPAPCLNTENPWKCPELSLRQHLVRVLKLRELFPRGYIWLAPEVIGGKTWPCKGWAVEELGNSAEQAGYNWAKAALATYGQVEGVILAMTNEEWCAESGRVEAYNQWRRGFIRAHRENPSCAIAVGARHVRPREWKGERMPDGVGDVAPDVWAYVDSVGGWADYHAHGIEAGKFLPHGRATEATDYADFFAWSAWLDERYPHIRKSVGEIAYTTSEPGQVATDEQKRADWPTYAKLIRGLAAEADLVFLYQIEDHSAPEGAFSGSGVYPALVPQVKALGRQAP